MESKGKWKGKIINSFDFFGSVRYIIEIVKPTETYLIRRRYNNFYSFHKALTSFSDLDILTEQLQLPPKCYSILGPSEQFLRTRLAMLQTYLDTLSSAPGLREYSLIADFIAQDGGGHPDFVDSVSSSKVPLQPQLPFKTRFPVLPEGGFKTLCKGSKLCTETDYERIYHDGEHALFGLFILGQMLEISTSPQNRISAYDSQRPTIENSVLVLRSMVPQLEQIQRDLEKTNDNTNDNTNNSINDNIHIVNDILDNIRNGIEWGRAAEDKEIEEIERVHKGTKIRRIDHYRTAAEALLSDSAAAAAAADPSVIEKEARELGGQIRDEMEARSQVGEVSSVKRLRELWTALGELSAQQRAERRAAAPATPERVAAGLRRRVERLSAKTEDVVLHQGSGSMGDARSVLEEVETLERDIEGWRKEFESGGSSKRFEEVEPSVAKTLEIAQHLGVSLRLMTKSRTSNNNNYDDNNNNNIELE